MIFSERVLLKHMLDRFLPFTDDLVYVIANYNENGREREVECKGAESVLYISFDHIL